MENLTNYIKPELLVVSVVLYLIGTWLKKLQFIKNKFLPLILGAIGIILCTIWVLASCPLTTAQNIAMAVFTAIVQGILVTGLSMGVNQLISKTKKADK